jgi:hypothetical protein
MPILRRAAAPICIGRMIMKITEIAIIGLVPLYFQGRQIGSIEARTCAGGIDCLGIRLECGVFLELSAAMDISEQLQAPRIFVIEGKPNETFAIFGGERIYWISTAGKVVKDFQTFRTYAEAEYWETKIINRPSDAVLIYESGVSVIDEDLRIRCHKIKFFNDFFAALEGDSITLLRDHDVKWRMQLVQENDSRPS